VWLRRLRDRVTVSVEVNGSWRLVIDDDLTLERISWVVEPLGIETSPPDAEANQVHVR